MTWRELAPRGLYDLRKPLLIDVRSPCEFADEHIPEALNIPLLSDSERVLVGTLYKEQGELFARRYALKFIAPKIPSIVDQIADLRKQGQHVVVHCWRGGLRSEAVASVLSIAGVPCYRLTGGYKAWRAIVLEDLNKEENYAFSSIVLYGMTGCGKTELLEKLEESGEQVIDLEALANHRGSIFGGLGRGKQPSQKNFEAALWNKLRCFDMSKPVFLECESRKIGRITVPDLILKKIKEGVSVYIQASTEQRIRRLLQTYAQIAQANEEQLAKEDKTECTKPFSEALSLLELIKPRLGKAKCLEIKSLIEKEKVSAAVEILLVDYYDPLYRESTKHVTDYSAHLDNDEIDNCLNALIGLSQRQASYITASD